MQFGLCNTWLISAYSESKSIRIPRCSKGEALRGPFSPKWNNLQCVMYNAINTTGNNAAVIVGTWVRLVAVRLGVVRPAKPGWICPTAVFGDLTGAAKGRAG